MAEVDVHFIVTVWGEEYTRLFVTTVLPSYLSPGNLGVTRARDIRASFRIYTTTWNINTLQRAPSVQHLMGLMPVIFESIDNIELADKYGALAESHRRAIMAAASDEATLVFLSPDGLCSDGTFANAIDAALRGKRAVMIAGLRAVKESFLPWFRERYVSRADGCIAVASRDLVRDTLRFLHPHSRSLIWGSSVYPNWAANLFFQVGKEGFVARCFHLHPLLVNPRKRDVLPFWTVDDDYLSRAGLTLEDFHIVSDSDDGFVCDVSHRDQFGEAVPGRASVERVAAWASRHASAMHLRYVRHPIYLHAGELGDEWDAVVRTSDEVVDSVMRMVEARGVAKAWAWLRWAIADPRVECRRWARTMFGERNVTRVARVVRRLRHG